MPALPHLGPIIPEVSDVLPVPDRPESGIRVVGDRDALARTALADGEELLSRGQLERASERFRAASQTFDDLGDSAGSAQALLGLGKVLLGLEDPVCREVLEDAGTHLEDLGDEAGMKEVDKLLRVAEKSMEESPRSFVAGHGRRPSGSFRVG